MIQIQEKTQSREGKGGLKKFELDRYCADSFRDKKRELYSKIRLRGKEENMYISSFKNESVSFCHERVTDSAAIVDYYPKGNDRYTLLFFPKGNVFLHTELGEEKLSSCDVVFVPNNVFAKMISAEREECEFFHVSFTREILERFNYFIVDETKVKCVHCFNEKELLAIFEKIEFYLLHLSEGEFSDVFQTFFKELIYFLKIQETPLFSYSEKEYPPIFIDVLHYVNKHLFTIKNVTEINSAVYISYPYLIKLFKKYLQITPKKYITEQRILAAHRLILQGERPIKVYEKCGFETYRMFYRCYSSYFGNAPTKQCLLDETETLAEE